MTLNIELDESTGAKLDALAKANERSRHAQARKLLRDAIEAEWADDLLFVETQPEEDEA